jgi:hypothetical protein
VRPRQGSGLVLRAIAFGRSSRRAHATGVIQSSPKRSQRLRPARGRKESSGELRFLR